MKIVQVEYARILLTLDVQVEKKPLNCKTYWLPTILPTTGPMVPTDCAVPRSMPGDDGAGLFEGRQRISKAVRKQVQLLLFPGTIWG